MQRWILVGIFGLFFALIAIGVMRQMGNGGGLNTAVPTLVPTFSPALFTVQLTPQNVIPPTFTPLSPSTSPEILPGTHTIQTGETLFSIARQYGVALDALTAANGLGNPDVITVGQVLTIPTLVPTPDPAVPVDVASTDTPLSPSPLPPPAIPDALNGIPLASIIFLPENVLANVQAIFAQGQALGRNPHAYSKVGDSTIQNPHFMARFDEPGGYNLRSYAYLQPAVDYFWGSHGREGMAVRQGFHSWTVTDPMWADKTVCQANETPIACEIRVHNPAILIIRLGSNDSGVPDMFDQNVRQIVELTIASGIIPVIGTKADRFEGSNINNDILRQIAADYQIPLWDFDVAAQMIPGRGLDVDNVHLTSYFAHDYGSPEVFTRGHGVHSLTALMMLEALLQEVILPGVEASAGSVPAEASTPP